MLGRPTGYRNSLDSPRIAAMALVLVLHARRRGGAVTEALTRLLGQLPYAKRLELERREPGARIAGLAGLWLALEGAARLRGREVDVASLRFPPDGKPYLEGGPYFSISHGPQHVAAAVCESVDIGFDLEEVGTGPGDSSKGPKKLQLWTATEAILKAAGLGLREARSVELDDSLVTGTLAGERYWLRPVEISTDVVAHLATFAAVESVEVVESSPPGLA
jgi:phosphopantetheinyl transferase